VLRRATPSSYTAYGLNIHSDLPLPELVAQEGTPDVIVRLGNVCFSPSEVVEGCFNANAEETYLFWEDAGKLLVRKGREIVVDPVSAVPDEVLRLFVLGPALGVLLHQRGQLILHASSVATTKGVVAFLGASGWGKSTMAATLHSRGYRVVADDVTAVQVDAATGVPVVFPGFPQLKLWPEAVVSLGEAPERLPCVEPGWDKRARSVASGFAQEALPLRRIYLLAEGESHKIEPLSPQEGLVELIRHTYGAHFLRTIEASHFIQCATVAKSISIARLRRPRVLSELSELTQLVEKDLAHNVE